MFFLCSWNSEGEVKTNLAGAVDRNLGKALMNLAELFSRRHIFIAHMPIFVVIKSCV